jgi:hypothetical protein
MNEEQARRRAEATEAIILAADVLDDAREAVNDSRSSRELERDRMSAAQQMASRIETAGKRIEDALRKACVAAAVNGRADAWSTFRVAQASVREARAKAKAAPDADGAGAKQNSGREAVERLAAAIETAAALVFAA